MTHRSPKVLGIGLSRTGTTSLHHALEILGLRSVHWLMDYRHLYRWDAATDSNMALAYKVLDVIHPNSKFILTLRRHQTAWFESMRFMMRHIRATRVKFDYSAMDLTKVFMGIYDTVDDFTDQILSHAYQRHVQDVRRYFRDRPHDLLEMDITMGDGWEKLCPFLAKPIPPQAFPHTNTFTRPKQMVTP